MPAKARRALIQFLREPGLERPATIETAVPPEEWKKRKLGAVVSNVVDGELFLRSKSDDRRIRLAWKKEDKERDRPLPVGEYEIVGYRVVKKDKAGREWFISATSHGDGDVVVKKGRSTTVTISDTIRFRSHARRRKGSLRCALGIQGEHRAGLSIYCDGKRIDIPYKVFDRDKKILASGNVKYG